MQKKLTECFCDFPCTMERIGKDFLLGILFPRMSCLRSFLLICIIILPTLLLVVFSSQVLHAQKIENLTQDQDIKLVWAAKNDGQGEQIYFSSLKKNSWSTPVQLSYSANLVFQPAISSGTDGKVWGVWSVQDKNGSFLQFTVYSDSKWMQPTQINTGKNNNKAVTIVVDRKNVPWIAWTAVNDMYPDIYWSRWNGRGWDLPVRAHAENKVPDIQPALTLDESGNINLSWQTFVDGKYITVSRLWNGHQWQTVSNELEKNIRKKLIQGEKGRFLVPDFVEDPRKASFFINKKDGAASIPLSYL